jgi:hypothetical protein
MPSPPEDTPAGVSDEIDNRLIASASSPAIVGRSRGVGAAKIRRRECA